MITEADDSRHDRDMSKKTPPPRSPFPQLSEPAQIAAEIAESFRETLPENVDVSTDTESGAVVVTAVDTSKADKKRKALIVRALGEISAKKLREILADRLTLAEALELAGIE